MTIDVLDYRRVISHFASGVTVLTTAVNGRLHGMTANALCSLSLEPTQILICVDHKAHLLRELEEAGRFAVNILSAGQEELSRLFAVTAGPEEGRLRGAAYRIGPNGSPLLEGALAYLECDVADRCPGGDHTIFVGSVVGAEVLSDGPPLLFFQSKYRTMQP